MAGEALDLSAIPVGCAAEVVIGPAEGDRAATVHDLPDLGACLCISSPIDVPSKAPVPRGLMAGCMACCFAHQELRVFPRGVGGLHRPAVDGRVALGSVAVRNRFRCQCFCGVVKPTSGIPSGLGVASLVARLQNPEYAGIMAICTRARSSATCAGLADGPEVVSPTNWPNIRVCRSAANKCDCLK